MRPAVFSVHGEDADLLLLLLSHVKADLRPITLKLHQGKASKKENLAHSKGTNYISLSFLTPAPVLLCVLWCGHNFLPSRQILISCKSLERPCPGAMR